MNRFSSPIDDCYDDNCETKYEVETSSDEEEEQKVVKKCEKPKRKKKVECDPCENVKTFDVYSKIGDSITMKSESNTSTVSEELELAFNKLGISKKMGYNRKYLDQVDNSHHVSINLNIEFNGTGRDFLEGKANNWELDTDFIKYHAGHVLAAQELMNHKDKNVSGLADDFIKKLGNVHVTIGKGTYKDGKNDLPFSVACDITGVQTNSLTNTVCKGLYVHGNQHTPYKYDQGINESIDTTQLENRVKLYGALTKENIMEMVGSDKGDNHVRIKYDSALYKNFFSKRVENYGLHKKTLSEKNIVDGKYKLKTSIANQVIADAIKEREKLPMYQAIKATISPANGKSWAQQFQNLDMKGNSMNGKNQIFKSGFDLDTEHNVTFTVKLDLGMYC